MDEQTKAVNPNAALMHASDNSGPSASASQDMLPEGQTPA